MKTPRRFAVLLAATCVALLTGFLGGPAARTSSAPGSPPAAPSSVEALTTRAEPVPLADLFPEFGPGSGGPAVSAGLGSTCLVSSGGGVLCWGAGPLGDGTVTSQGRPVHVARAGSGIAAVVTGYEHTCVLSSGGRVQCWGANSAGQLGDGTTIERVTPVDVTGLAGGVRALTAGASHTCADRRRRRPVLGRQRGGRAG